MSRSTVRSSLAAAMIAGLSLVAGCTAEAMEMDPDALPDDPSLPDQDRIEDPMAAGSPYDFQPIEPCLTEEDYVSRGVVRFSLSHEPFTPSCLRLASGGGATVVFQGRLAEHPIEPRDSGTQPSPIVSTGDGGSIEFEFPDAGFFPYRCAEHPEETGVVWASWF